MKSYEKFDFIHAMGLEPIPLLGIVCSALLGISSYYTIHELLYYHNRAVNFFQFVNTAKPQIDIIIFFRDLPHNHHKENSIKPLNSQTNLSSFPYKLHIAMVHCRTRTYISPMWSVFSN